MAIAIIVAGGNSKRMKGKTPKLLLPISGKPVLYHTISNFYDHPEIENLILVVNKKINKDAKKIVRTFFSSKKNRVKIVIGGKSRAQSVLAGINYCKKYLKSKKKDILVIHNGANPIVHFDEISLCIKKAKKTGACTVIEPLTSTLKEISKKYIVKTHDRNKFAKAQTPQCFIYEKFIEALVKVGSKYADMTDESSLFETAGMKVSHIPASLNNIKITTQTDYEQVKHILGDLPDDYIVGLGQDSHEFSNKKGLTLGGIFIPDEKRMKANSDGDVIVHAICNGLLQAIGEKSLGAFANNWCKKKKIRNSIIYLEKIVKKVRRKKYKVNNIGVMIEAKHPKIDLYSKKMREKIAKACDIPIQRVGITATSGENLTPFGKGKAIQAYSIVTIKKA